MGGRSDLAKRQDPVAWDKMIDQMVSHLSTILGHVVNTRLMEVSIPQAYIARTLAALTPFHRGRKAFKLKEMEQLTGMLVYIACTVPWLRFLLSQMFSSVAAAVGDRRRKRRHASIRPHDHISSTKRFARRYTSSCR